MSLCPGGRRCHRSGRRAGSLGLRSGTVVGAAQKPNQAGPESPGLPAVTLALFLILSCTTVTLTGGGRAGADYQIRWILVASDLFLGLVVVSQLPRLPELWTHRANHRCALAATALVISLLPSLAVHPSARGGAAVLRWAGVAMIAFAVGRLVGAGRSLVVVAFAGVTVVQVAVALGERAVGGPIGLGALGEPDAYEIGGRYASSGLTVHPYVFAAWCALGGAILLAAVARARRPLGALAGAAVLPFAGVGLTMSRAGALAVALVLASFAVAALRRTDLRLVFLGAVAATALGVAVNLPGWVNRTVSSVDSEAGGVTSGRGELLDQAWGLLRLDPAFGTGPGRYVEVLVGRPELVELATQRPLRPVHVVPYLVLVEGGLVTLPALLLLVWAVFTQARRGGAVSVGVALSLVPFLLLDHLSWSYPQGLLLTGLWLGTLDHLAGRRHAPAAPERVDASS